MSKSTTGIEVPKNINGVISRIRTDLYEYTKNERMQYKNIYDEVESYVNKNKLLISNIYAITKNIDHIEYFIDFHYDIYCHNPVFHAHELINILFTLLKKDPLVNTLVLNTAVKNEELSIHYNNRTVAKLFALEKTKSDISGKAPRIGNIQIGNLLYLPANVEIIDVYHKLYTGICDVTMYRKFEEFLSDMVISDNKLSSDESTEVEKIKKAETCYDRKREELEAIKVAILKDCLVGRNDTIVLGAFAVDWLTQGEQLCPKHDRIQIMSTRSVKYIHGLIQKFLNMTGHKYIVNIGRELDLMVPKDFRTKRIVFSIGIKTDMGMREKPFLEYFNSCEFELIPAIIHNNLLIASKDVILRFLYVDMFVNRYIYNIGKLDKSIYIRKQDRLLELIKQTISSENIADGTLGNFYDYDISKKELIKDQDQFFVPYYPHDYMIKFNKLKQIKQY